MTKFTRTAKNGRTNRPAKARSTKKRSLPGTHLMLGMLLVGAGVFYLLQMNALATKGYQIKDLEGSIAELQQENNDLELQALSLQSNSEVNNRVKTLGMVNVGQPDYLEAHAVAVAR